MAVVKLRLRLLDTLDRRTPEQLRAHDAIERKLFAWRVARNPKERARLAKMCTS